MSTPRPGMDPELYAALDAAGVAALATITDIEQARADLRVLTAPPTALRPVRTKDRSITGCDGRSIPLRVYWPDAPAASYPIVVFYHGGGFALGDLDLYEELCRTICLDTDAIVVAPAYRLAPEHPFPAAVDDAWSVLRWVGEHARELGGDPARIAVAGDSAGGNLAAVAAQLARDGGGPALVYQWLLYPVTTFDFTLPSIAENADAPILNLANAVVLLNWYAPGADLLDPPPTLAPARGHLVGLPPAYVGTAGLDALRDDGARYAALLQSAGVPVELRCADTLIHGYAYFAAAVPAAAAALQEALLPLRAALHPER